MKNPCWLCDHIDECPTPEQCFRDLLPAEPAVKGEGE